METLKPKGVIFIVIKDPVQMVDRNVQVVYWSLNETSVPVLSDLDLSKTTCCHHIQQCERQWDTCICWFDQAMSSRWWWAHYLCNDYTSWEGKLWWKSGHSEFIQDMQWYQVEYQ